MHLWDNASTNLADFTTHFSFVIAATTTNKTAYADGLAFFLAPVDSQILDTRYSGGTLGLTSYDLALNSTKNDFVAGEHVGIDINSMESVANASWWSIISIREGKKNEAWISYNSTSYNLSFLSFNVDLRKHLPEKVTFGFSATTGYSSAVHTICSWNFTSMVGAPSPSPVLTPKLRGNNKLGLGVGLGAGGLFLVVGSGRDKEDDRAFAEYMDGEFQEGTGPKRFSFKELTRATNNFSNEEKLGQGGFGDIYKGFLRDSNIFGMKVYVAEVKIISRLRHRNLFMPNGSLDSHLFREERLLIWEVRYKIAQGLASSLLYLHEGWEQCMVHRDIKSSNIMLDSNFNAKLGDFGLARLVDHAKGSQTTVLAGTFGYMAPECVTTGKASKESDIACGRKPINPKAPEDQVALVEWVWELYGKGDVLEAADPRLGGDFNGEQMECLIIVGMWCAHPDRNLRPSIRQAIHVFNFEAPLPVLRSRILGPAYLPPAVNRFSTPLSMSDVATNFEGRKTQYSSYSQS
ncbi:hypothetical protein I3843_06G152500 [Carya illinoinensis]|nr:hypothetical protein I3843_06G152500 [Carya illinoinensis]